MAKTFAGSTKEAGGQFLGANFWKKGVKIEGQISGTFLTEVGKSYNAHLTKPVIVNGEKTDVVSIGGLKGLSMALRASGANEFREGDLFIIECIGHTPTNKGNAQIDFKVVVNRP